jgi:type IV pilus assembly protein PilB
MSDSSAAKSHYGRIMLGESLVRRGAITEEQLALALKEQERTGGHVGEILVALGFTTQEEITRSLATQAGVEEIDLNEIEVPPEALALLDQAFCRERKVLPIAADEHQLRIAMANSLDVLTVDEVGRLTGRAVEVMAASEPAMLEALDRVFGGDVQQSLEVLIVNAATSVARSDEIGQVVGEQPVVRLVEALLREGVRRGATDLHIEPEERLVRCRYRVDGALLQGPTLPKSIQSAVNARIKILSGLDISETRLPQDGKVVTQVRGRHINLRVSTMPTVHGENTVLRILDRNRLSLGLADLGFSDITLAGLHEAIARPAGIILVTGPTGSGKTTTLYAALSEINTLDRKIATLEDPVEYELPVIRQAQVNTQTGLTFGVGLRALLRQDPDVILVGEMRDRETAEVALRAAMTGHLVLSTLHTNSAAGAIPRLLDMGMQPYLLASTLNAVMAQRLLRKLCPRCRVPEQQPDPEKMSMVGLEPGPGVSLHRAQGCEKCNGTGFRGRRGLGELLRVTPTIAKMISQRADSSAIAQAAVQDGMVLMEDEAREMVRTGETSLDEAIRHICVGGLSQQTTTRKAA